MRQTRTVCIWFCIAAALVAASVADPLVEFASNGGIFGSGSFTDGSNQDVLPALCAGLAFGAVYVFLRARRILGGYVRHSALWPLLPYVFLAQIALLYSLETAEQVVVIGHPLGGAIWLGGPPIASLAAHGTSCVLTTFLLASLARHLAQRAVTIVEHIAAAIAFVPRSRALAFVRVSPRPDARRRGPRLSRIGERAPPLAA